ncbi:hypothetical protein ZOSMA_177G00130 [Zostera marina]|uniref:Transcription repressor n=1 Tax=Zostera marina TaxID=29655 RepID=A0A0K9PTY3_ZOSMR|nr:hypothetical protein ZOSMA_177G00130 [Zostera marina]
MTIGKRIKFCISSILKFPSMISENIPYNQTIHHRISRSASSSSSIVFSDFNSICNAASIETDCIHSSRCSFPAPEDFNVATEETTTATSTATETIVEFSTAIATRRLTMSSPGRSNSIVDSAEVGLGSIGIVVQTYSLDPYAEFRRSMEEMAAAIACPVGGEKEQLRQERLYELLVCYLALNNKSVHKDIVNAFVDLFSHLQIESDG